MESFSETLSMCLYKRYVWDSGICICYIVSVQNSVTCHLAFASARLMALRRLVAGQALDFEHGLCSICILDRHWILNMDYVAYVYAYICMIPPHGPEKLIRPLRTFLCE